MSLLNWRVACRVLVRPAPVGVFTPHEIRAVYFGESGLGHIGRFNVDHAVYYVFGHDELNPIAGPDPTLGISIPLAEPGRSPGLIARSKTIRVSVGLAA